MVKCQETRSRTQNRKIARNQLALRIDEMENGESSRNAALAAFKKRKADSATKKKKRKYKKLDEDKATEDLSNKNTNPKGPVIIEVRK